MKKPKMRLIGYKLRRKDGYNTLVGKLEPTIGGAPNKIDIHGVLIDLHDAETLAGIAHDQGCKLVPIYERS